MRVTVLDVLLAALSDLPQATPNISPCIYRVGWDLDSYSHLLLPASRINAVEEVDGENGLESIYRTKEDFNGPLAWGVNMFVAKSVQKDGTDGRRAQKSKIHDLLVTLANASTSSYFQLLSRDVLC